MIKIKVDKITPRIQYAFEFIFEWTKEEFELTLDSGEFEYLEEGTSDNSILASNLLVSDSIELQEIEKSNYLSEPCYSFNGITDPIATIFYILTRYEEYLPSKRDEHDRYLAQNSKQFEFGWMKIALADRLRLQILNKLNIEVNRPEFKIIPSFDIDNTFAYKYKNGVRNFLSIGKDFLSNNKSRIQERKSVKNGGLYPYDTYNDIQKIALKFPNTILFWLCAEWSTYDRNLSIKSSEHRDLIQKLSESIKIGIHPGYASYLKDNKVNKEIKALESIIGNPINSSRQHFLKLRLPESYQILIANKIDSDFTMGYAEQTGYRAGTSSEYYWFDLSKNHMTELKIVPFAYMDGTLNEYMRLSIDEAKKEIDSLLNESKEYGSHFSFLWHNETIGDYGKWRGWSELLYYSLKDE